jgi:NADH-quinone oxidoreductase subunit H
VRKLILFYIFYFVILLVIIMFYTIFERKLLATIQHRSGPTLVWSFGLNQSWVDGVKLFFSEIIFISTRHYVLLICGPFLILVLSFLNRLNLPLGLTFLSDNQYGLLIIFIIWSLNIYILLFSGRVTNSRYALLGSIRAILQLLAYEIFFGLIIVNIFILTKSLSLASVVMGQTLVWFCFPLLIPCILFFIAITIETNRTPFDLPEAEAELIAGPYTEYSSFLFAFFFISEYSNILFNIFLFILLFFGYYSIIGLYGSNSMVLAGQLTRFLMVGFSVKFGIFSSLLIIFRASFPRIRYDQLLLLSRTILLPVLFGHTFYLFCIILRQNLL